VLREKLVEGLDHDLRVLGATELLEDLVRLRDLFAGFQRGGDWGALGASEQLFKQIRDPKGFGR
jgi:hypothetical protein